MAFEEIQSRDLLNQGQSMNPDNNSVVEGLIKLREDFDAHNHDGSSSRQLDNIVAQTIQVKSAIIGGYKLFEAIVAPTGGDFKFVAAALKAGKTRIFVRNGTYTNEPIWNLTANNTTIIGESKNGVDITFAQDTTNSGSERCINFGANNIVISDMGLRSYVAAAQDLFRFPTSLYGLIQNCNLQNTRGALFHGVTTGYFHTIKDCIFNYSTISDTTNCKAFNALADSTVIDCHFDISSNSTGWNLVDTCPRMFFTSCRIVSASTTAVFKIVSSPTTFFTNCYLKFISLVLETNFEACILENNGNAPSGYFLDTNAAATRICNSRIILDKTYDIINIDTANVQFNGNYIEGGKKILLEHASLTLRGIQVCNNNWVSDYTVAAMDLNLGSVRISQAMILGNVIRNSSGSFTPTITDGGTSTLGVATNQLING